jgi:hypothetical protein
MKKICVFMSIYFLFFLTACSAFKTAPETIKKVSAKIDAKDFTILTNYAIPLRMQPVNLTSEYSLRIKNDSAFAFLPYFGVAHVAPYNSGDGGIKFAEKMYNFHIKPIKKSTGWEITFKVKPKTMTEYEVYLNVFENGSVSFNINSYEKDMISFSGNMKLDE